MAIEKSDKLKVLFLAAEADPFIKVGGLADYAGSLPKALMQLQRRSFGNLELDIRIAIPFHGRIDRNKWGIKFLFDFPIIEKGKKTKVRVFSTILGRLTFYFISRQQRERSLKSAYLETNAKSGRKFAFFSIASLELLKCLNWKADIIHANDWHTAFAVIKLAQIRKNDPFFSKTKSLLTIHNLAYMGGGSEKSLADFELNPVYEATLPSWAQKQPLPMALVVADGIVAVSPSYAQEIKTAEFGYGLERLIKKRGNAVSGILNGIDYEKWDPSADMCLERQYSIHSNDNRKFNKVYLQKYFHLPIDARIPLITIISRLDHQKGIDLIVDGFKSIKKSVFQMIILGSGNSDLENKCQQLEIDIPDKVRAILKFDPRLADQLYGGADLILIPSRFEPCGLTQMIAMRYGCLPLARSVGGLKDSIRSGFNGFLFEEFAILDFIRAFRHFLVIFKKEKKTWAQMQQNAMRTDHSWEKSARAYARLYRKLKAD